MSFVFRCMLSSSFSPCLIFIHPQDLIRRLFVCISACPTNYASDLGKILKSVFFTIQTKEEESQMSRKRRTRRTGPSGEVIPVLQGLKLHNW